MSGRGRSEHTRPKQRITGSFRVSVQKSSRGDASAGLAAKILQRTGRCSGESADSPENFPVLHVATLSYKPLTIAYNRLTAARTGPLSASAARAETATGMRRARLAAARTFGSMPVRSAVTASACASVVTRIVGRARRRCETPRHLPLGSSSMLASRYAAASFPRPASTGALSSGRVAEIDAPAVAQSGGQRNGCRAAVKPEVIHVLSASSRNRPPVFIRVRDGRC